MPAQCERDAVAGAVVLPGEFRRAGVRGAEPPGAVRFHRAGNHGRAIDAHRGGLRLQRLRLLPRLDGSGGRRLRPGDGGGRGEDDLAAHRARQPDSGRGGRLLGRDEGRIDLRLALRDDRPAPHVRVRHKERAPVDGRGEEPRGGGAQSGRAHAQGDHARTGDERQADRRAAQPVRLLAGLRWRGGGAAGAARTRPRIHQQTGAGAGHRTMFGLRGAGPERVHRDFSGRPARGRTGVSHGRRDAARDRIRRVARLLHHRRNRRHRGPGVRGKRAGRAICICRVHGAAWRTADEHERRG